MKEKTLNQTLLTTGDKRPYESLAFDEDMNSSSSISSHHLISFTTDSGVLDGIFFAHTIASMINFRAADDSFANGVEPGIGDKFREAS